MRRVQRWRYYCEYCGKGGGSAYHMARHEKACTANPHRECGLCREAELEQQPMEDLVTALLCHDHDYDKGLVVLREAAQNCPSCILAAIRQSKVQRPYMGEDDEGVHVNFDFKAEQAEFWNSINDAKLQDEYAFCGFGGAIYAE